VDINRYRRLLFRASDAILEPIQGSSQPSIAVQAVQLDFEIALE
jgi:hypothetical protein